MVKLKANDLDKVLKVDWMDITLSELRDAYTLLHSQPMLVKAHLLSGKDCPEDELLKFKIEWVAQFSNFTKEELKLIPINDRDSLSLDQLYEWCKKFIGVPEAHLDLKEFKHNGKKYKLLEPLRTIGGAQMLFGNANYRQFMLSNQLAKVVEDNRTNAKVADGLIQLLAVLYECDGQEMEASAKEFETLPALFGWSGYFFFAMLVEKYNDFFRLSTKSPLHLQKAMRLKKWEQQRKRLSNSFIGKLLPSKSQNWEYLILHN